MMDLSRAHIVTIIGLKLASGQKSDLSETRANADSVATSLQYVPDLRSVKIYIYTRIRAQSTALEHRCDITWLSASAAFFIYYICNFLLRSLSFRRP